MNLFESFKVTSFRQMLGDDKFEKLAVYEYSHRDQSDDPYADIIHSGLKQPEVNRRKVKR